MYFPLSKVNKWLYLNTNKDKRIGTKESTHKDKGIGENHNVWSPYEAK